MWTFISVQHAPSLHRLYLTHPSPLPSMHTRFPSLTNPTTELSLETVPSSPLLPPSLKLGLPWLLLPQYPVPPIRPHTPLLLPPPHTHTLITPLFFPWFCPIPLPQPTPFPQHLNMPKPLLVLSSPTSHPGSPLPFSD